MALDFLLNMANTVQSIAGPVQAIMGAIRGPKKVPRAGPVPQPAAERASIALLKALADPDNALVQSMTREEFENLMASFGGDVRSKVLADRRERSLGREGVFFDPERADENISFQLSRGAPMIMQTARQNAINRILQAAGQGKFAPAQAGRIRADLASEAARQEEIAAREAETGSVFDRFGRGVGAIENILDVFKGQSVPIPGRKPTVPSQFLQKVY